MKTYTFKALLYTGDKKCKLETTIQIKATSNALAMSALNNYGITSSLVEITK